MIWKFRLRTTPLGLGFLFIRFYDGEFILWADLYGPLYILFWVHFLRQSKGPCPVILYKHKKIIRGPALPAYTLRRSSQSSDFWKYEFRKRKIRGRKLAFSTFESLFFLPFSDNERHIYRPNWFDLGPSYFDDKCHCSCDIWQHLSSSAHVDWHMDIQTCLQIRGMNVLSLGYFY